MDPIEVNHNIKVSVIIPTHNRLQVLQRVVSGLRRQNFTDFEVIIVEDGSTDGTLEWLQSSAGLPTNWRVLRTAAAGAATARNQGVGQARGEILLFLDDDTIPQSDLVKRHWQIHQNRQEKNICIMGKIIMSKELMKPDQIRWRELDLPAPPQTDRMISHLKYRTANSSLRRDLFFEAGGFHPGLIASEDLEFAFRLHEMGVRFYYYDDIVAEHFHPVNLKQYIEKGKTYGKAVAYWYRMSPQLHPQLALRYGLYHPSLPSVFKLRYLFKRLTVNGCTVPLIKFLARWLRRIWFGLSDRLYKALFGYYLRREFRRYSHTALCMLGFYC